MSPSMMTSKKHPEKASGSETVLRHALLMTQVGMDLKEQYTAAEKYIFHLKTVLSTAEKSIGALQCVAKNALSQAQKMVTGLSDAEASESPSAVMKQECDRLLSVIDRQLNDLEFRQTEDYNCDEGLDQMREISGKIRQLEGRQKTSSENNVMTPNTSSRNIKTDERYPENLSRESLIDLNAVQNLAPVPEDIFTSFSSRPSRSSSLSSLKSMRKIKMYLQRAESSDDDDSSDADEHDYSKLIYGDVSEEQKFLSPHSPTNKKCLGNIKEEAHDQ